MPNLNVTEIKAFVPARDFPLSKQFYQDLGFTLASDGDGVAYFQVLRGILGKWKLTDRVLVNWLSPNTPPPSPCCRRASY
ncbi:hypothetical protein [Aeromonas sp. ASNIH8]|uniref:hypothetical protein n=1 Tax=Aeromonas sp. ASNIH8 TaxID=1920113 RepID=UPI001CA4723E|nr:hypothetical protein [Aeromonas sp. ASNIH8]